LKHFDRYLDKMDITRKNLIPLILDVLTEY